MSEISPEDRKQFKSELIESLEKKERWAIMFMELVRENKKQAEEIKRMWTVEEQCDKEVAASNKIIQDLEYTIGTLIAKRISIDTEINRDSPFMALYHGIPSATVCVATMIINKLIASNARPNLVTVTRYAILIDIRDRLLKNDLITHMRIVVYENGCIDIRYTITERIEGKQFARDFTHPRIKEIDEKVNIIDANFVDIVFDRCLWLANNVTEEYVIDLLGNRKDS